METSSQQRDKSKFEKLSQEVSNLPLVSCVQPDPKSIKKHPLSLKKESSVKQLEQIQEHIES